MATGLDDDAMASIDSRSSRLVHGRIQTSSTMFNWQHKSIWPCSAQRCKSLRDTTT